MKKILIVAVVIIVAVPAVIFSDSNKDLMDKVWGCVNNDSYCTGDLMDRLVKNIKIKDNKGYTPLMIFSRNDKHFDKVKLLVEKGASVNAKVNPGGSEGGKTALIFAAENCQKKNTAYFLSHGGTLNVNMAVDGEGGYRKYVQSVINGIIQAPRWGGRGINNPSFMQDCNECLKEILKYEKNKKNINSALYFAANNGNIEMVRMLVESGADINSNDGGTFPLIISLSGYYCLSSWCPDIYGVAAYLLEKGADVNVADYYGWNALMYAGANVKFTNLVPNIISRGADVNKADKYGITPLMVACPESAKILIDKGADVNARVKSRTVFKENKKGKREYHPTILEDIIQSFKGNLGGCSAIMIAARRGSPEMVKLLIKKGADVNLRDDEGKAALSHAKSANLVDTIKNQIIDLLTDAGAKE